MLAPTSSTPRCASGERFGWATLRSTYWRATGIVMVISPTPPTIQSSSMSWRKPMPTWSLPTANALLNSSCPFPNVCGKDTNNSVNAKTILVAGLSFPSCLLCPPTHGSRHCWLNACRNARGVVWNAYQPSKATGSELISSHLPAISVSASTAMLLRHGRDACLFTLRRSTATTRSNSKRSSSEQLVCWTSPPFPTPSAQQPRAMTTCADCGTNGLS